jgi:hypothetical protein
MKDRREFLKDTATGALILGSQNEFGLVGMLELRAETEKRMRIDRIWNLNLRYKRRRPR